LLVIFTSTVAGNFLFRRSMWYRALYNGSQLMLRGAAALVRIWVGGPCSGTSCFPSADGAGPRCPHESRIPGRLLSRRADLHRRQQLLMAWLMSAMTGRRSVRLWQENCLYPEEIRAASPWSCSRLSWCSSTARWGSWGSSFSSPARPRPSSQSALLAVLKAQDDILRSERMTAMGRWRWRSGEHGEGAGRAQPPPTDS
jgi:hypothetical protein